MIYEPKSEYIFDICEVCQRKLTKGEKIFCDTKTKETEVFHKLCNSCLDLRFKGRYPAL